MTRYSMTDRLPDYYLEPPEEDYRDWDDLKWTEKCERLMELPKDELVLMYLDLLEGEKK